MSVEKVYLDILKKSFNEQKKNRPRAFTMRALAKRAGVSHSLLSNIFSGKKRPSLKTLNFLYKELKLKNSQIYEIETSLYVERKRNHKLFDPEKLKYLYSKKFNKINLVEIRNVSLHDNWYLIPLLNLIWSDGFVSNETWIAHKLGISELEAKEAIQLLLIKKFIKIENQELVLIHKQIAFPKESALEYQMKLNQRALELFKINNAASDLQNRFIKNAVLSVNPQKIPLANAILEKALYEAIEILFDNESGNSTEVVSLGIQLFTLLRK